ncbi:ABC transporter permease [Glaciihabitans sp. UYNi722]|uniref:ABC transporter permease n=1 Tax=Glaciihabitans sp. UYNi722 TaxID=3156344 RepID=UPI00339AA762
MSARNDRQSFAAALVGSFSEAWAEVRIHRTRVLLSLIGVAVAVAAITSVVGLGSVAEQSLQESSERSGGRPSTLGVYANTNDGSPFDYSAISTAFETVTKRYKVDYHSVIINGPQDVQFSTGAASANVTAVDADWGTMHRADITKGSWFSESDADRLAPAIVVNDFFWKQLGSPDLRTHPTASLLGPHPVTAVVVGVINVPYSGDQPSMYMLSSAFTAISDPATLATLQPQYEAWVPPAISKKLVPLFRRDIRAAAGSGINVEVNRQDYAAYGEDPLLPVKIGVGGVAGLVLFLGALGLVNISLVTVRQRVREIGIRRSFGATAGRVFFAVMMESVVATFAAGVVGVGVAIAVVENPMVQALISQGVTELPPFPISAAIIGLVSATVVGALAGLLPAIAAVRFKVIDAIRY